ncbi:MAG: 4Fe-4S dicluster domain-containing protein [Planctomycetes bacterium]|nr:4Fe-4S dicluster domain-containing protein [Planctomycetota bacterium]
MFNILPQKDSNTGCNCDGGCGSETSADELTEAEFLKSRRGFLEKATTFMLGTASLTLLPASLVLSKEAAGTAGKAATGAGAAAIEQTPLYGFMVDTERCIGAGKCLTACRAENDVPEGFARTWVERYIHLKDGTVQVDTVPETGYADAGLPILDPDTIERSYFVPKLCNQCVDAPCNQVCPTHASITSPEGIELIDPELCIGCSYCVQACPYGIRFINPKTNNADKCDWCYHRITKDEQPACVEACPTGARIFGRLDDPNSEISKRLRKLPTSVLKEHLGTHPKLYYLDLPQEVI